MKQISCSSKYFCLGALLIFLGSVLLLSLGITIVLPYQATKEWKLVNCTVIITGYNTDHCSCTDETFEFEECVATYPCPQVYVTYPNPLIEHSNQTDELLNNTSLSNSILRNSIYGSNTHLKNSSENDRHDYKDPTGLRNILLKSKNDENILLNSKRDENILLNSSLSIYNNPFITKENDDQQFPNKSKSEIDENKRRISIQKQINKLLQLNENIERKAYIIEALAGGNLEKNSYPDIQFFADNELYTGVEIENVAMAYRSWSDLFYNSCSIHECGVEEWNIREGYSFLDSWGQQGQSFPCYISPKQEVIIQKVSYISMIQALFWPSLFLFCGAVIWFGMWCGCWVIENKHGQKTEKSSYIQ